MHRRRALLRIAILGFFLTGCAVFVATDLDGLYGKARPREREVALDSNWGVRYQSQVQPIIEKRCVVCHGCYDAPCQQLLSSPAGIERGASKELVYDTRLLQATPSRLADASSIAAWRERKFHPALNERDQVAAANLHASVLYRMLDLKQQHPLPSDERLPEDFSLALDRKQECSTIEEFDSFAKRRPLWGMPYGLPAVTTSEFSALGEWLAAGAPLPKARKPSPAHEQRIVQWEAFFNRDDTKSQLVARYLYEHLFLGHLYFDDLPPTHYFSLVRSTTPPGSPIQIVSTRRPYDDPGTARVYYRLLPVDDTLLAKTHMPYALGAARLAKWKQWFFDVPYTVNELPSYDAKSASNPFITFEQLPAASRYRFMLDHAHFTIDGFIKGPVCRGQVALNVINDRFWVFFFKPGLIGPAGAERFLAQESRHLTLPAESAGSILPIARWLQYSANQKAYLKAKYDLANRIVENRKKLSLDMIWDGEGTNSNAALTVFRHFDSATVVKGLIGTPPKTAWIIDYPILERIHYLLVAGFDVYGNVGHQLFTRLYMDFLRLEGEFNFLMFLPPDVQEKEWDIWYEGAPSQVRAYVKESSKYFHHQTDIVYKTTMPKRELYQLIGKKLTPILDKTYDIRRDDVPANQRRALEALESISGKSVSLLPQTTLLTVTGKDGVDRLYSLLHNNDHSNISSLLHEESNRRPERDSVTVTRGVVGAYPSAFMKLHEDELPRLVEAVALMNSEENYAALMRRFGVRRTNEKFWEHSDNVHALYQKISPIEYGLLDYNRLENR
jgi:hypothetical protein